MSSKTVLFLARMYDLLAAYSGSCILALLLTLVLSLSGNARLQGCISSLRKEQAFLIEWECKHNFYLLLANSSVQFSCSAVSNFLRPHGLQHTRLPCLSPTPGAYSNSRLLSQWCHPTISSSVVPFSSFLQSFPASGPFQMSQFFTSGDPSIGVLASASVLPMNSQDWFPLGWTGLISLQSKGLSRVFSNTTVQKHQFFGAQLSL